MLQGYTRPKRADIFGPSATGGSMNDAGERQLYQHGEGIGSIFSSLFSKFLPAAARTVKNIAQSKIVRDTGKQILDSTITGLTNATANAIIAIAIVITAAIASTISIIVTIPAPPRP